MKLSRAALSFFNTLRLKQNDISHFPDDIFNSIFLNENVWIFISLQLIPDGLINHIPALVQVMASCQTGDKPLFEPMVTPITDTYMCHSASMS